MFFFIRSYKTGALLPRTRRPNALGPGHTTSPFVKELLDGDRDDRHVGHTVRLARGCRGGEPRDGHHLAADVPGAVEEPAREQLVGVAMTGEVPDRMRTTLVSRISCTMNG